MVVCAEANEPKQLLAVSDGDGPDSCFFADDLRHARAVFFIEPLHEYADSAFGNAQRLGGKGDGEFLQRFASVKNQAHEECRPDSVGDDHR